MKVDSGFSKIRMNIILVWSITIIMCTFLAGLWYFVQPVTVYTTMVVENASISGGYNSTSSANVITTLKLASTVFIPIGILGFLAWAIVSSVRKEWRSVEE